MYYETLKKLRRAIQNKLCGMLSSVIIRPHTTAFPQDLQMGGV